MPRFVILEHDYPVLHWDLMLESGAVLRTWRLAEAPLPGKKVMAESSFDHRLVYLDYEGPVTQNRGTVRRWLAGHFDFVRNDHDLVELDVQMATGLGNIKLERTSDDCWIVQLGNGGDPTIHRAHSDTAQRIL